jgi:dolichyl-phosphate-mannose-protein mannosyltransferase
LRTWLIAALVGISSTLFFSQWISHPPVLEFDESKYVQPAREMLAGTQDESPDGPPLGKLILSGSMQLLGDNPRGWRAASAVFGGLTLAGLFLLAKLLLNDPALAATAVALGFLNHFVFVFSRTAMMDIFFLTFALWSVFTFAAALKMEGIGARKRRLLLALTGILIGLACASKWNGVDELCVFAAIAAGLLLAPERIKKSNPEIASLSANLREAGVLWFVIAVFVLPILPYTLAFWPYCRMLHLPMAWKEFVALHIYIWRFHLAVPGNPGLIESWYKWPFQVQPMRSLSYLVGNWYIMWGGLLALLFCLRRFGRSLPETLIVLLYFANYLQWAVTPQHCLYYYYYFPAAMFLGLAIPVALDRLPAKVYGVRLSVVSVLPALCIFIFCFGQMAHLSAPYDCILGCWP